MPRALRPGTAIAALAALLAPLPARAAWELNMPVGVTEISREVYHLHMLIFWICVVIGVVVFGAMLYSIYAHRKSRGVQAARFHESTTVEIVWTVIPFLILVAMAIPAAGTLIKMEDTRHSDLSVKVTGYQWLWQYEYLDHGVGFYSRLDERSNRARQLGSGIDPNTVENYLLDVDHRMVVPVDKKVRLLLTSNDVIHAWWVPALGGKKDAIPGYINEMWFRAEKTGVYRGQCAELCGRGHGFMPIVVEVVPQDEFEAWLQQRGGNVSEEQDDR
jgi:cytochrome c oxidase subunit 2